MSRAESRLHDAFFVKATYSLLTRSTSAELPIGRQSQVLKVTLRRTKIAARTIGPSDVRRRALPSFFTNIGPDDAHREHSREMSRVKNNEKVTSNDINYIAFDGDLDALCAIAERFCRTLFPDLAPSFVSDRLRYAVEPDILLARYGSEPVGFKLGYRTPRRSIKAGSAASTRASVDSVSRAN